MTKLRTLALFVCVCTRSRQAKSAKNFGLLKMACIASAFCLATAITSPAQTSIPLFSFDGTDGATPSGLIQATDGNFYGTTSAGGANSGGTIFQITPGGTLTTLYNFCSQPNCTDGYFPDGLMQATDGNFYGTTMGGGANSRGTVFQLSSAGTLTTLYSFCSQTNCTDGAGPFAGVIQATDGNFYGTTAAGGTNGVGSNDSGTVFEITPEGTLTTLSSFDGTDGGWVTTGLVQGTDGNFYGTTDAGGIYGGGTVFKITPAGTLTTLYGFCSQTNCADGGYPGGLIQATNGNFYGTTGDGGAIDDSGTVFQITAGGTLTTLYNFCSLPNCADGQEPDSLSQASDGNFYGTTNVGEITSHGTVFELTPAGVLTTLYSFCSQKYCIDGAFPSRLMQATDGNFYGTTGRGGASASKSSQGDGTVFTFGPPAVTLSHASLSFDNQALDETSAAQLVTLTNTSSIILTISSIAASTNFAVSSTRCGNKLAGDQKCNVSVTFTPRVLGLQTGTLTFSDNASNSPQTVALLGTGLAQAALTPTNYTFAKTKVGDASEAHRFTLKNNLQTTLTGLSYSTEAPFAISSTTCGATLNGKESCTISVTFTPTQTGMITGELSVSDSANNSPQASSLTGTGK
jgi:uncharacterized repeat protein (TIGR03803 family)